MKDLWDEPHSESGDYDVFFGNIMGACSMVTVMRKDKGPITDNGSSLSTAFVAFIDVPIPGDDPRFAWHDNVKGLPEKPFTQEWCLEQYNLKREAAFNAA